MTLKGEANEIDVELTGRGRASGRSSARRVPLILRYKALFLALVAWLGL